MARSAVDGCPLSTGTSDRLTGKASSVESRGTDLDADAARAGSIRMVRETVGVVACGLIEAVIGCLYHFGTRRAPHTANSQNACQRRGTAAQAEMVSVFFRNFF
jgi:hypothetical protein